RLNDRVRAGKDPAVSIEPRLVQRVGQGLDHSARGPRGKLRIAVQGDDETDIRQALRPAHVYKTAGAFRPRSVDQAVELLELSALSFPPDVFLLGFTPGPLPVKKEEALRPHPGGVIPSPCNPSTTRKADCPPCWPGNGSRACPPPPQWSGNPRGARARRPACETSREFPIPRNPAWPMCGAARSA